MNWHFLHPNLFHAPNTVVGASAASNITVVTTSNTTRADWLFQTRACLGCGTTIEQGRVCSKRCATKTYETFLEELEEARIEREKTRARAAEVNAKFDRLFALIDR